MIDEEEVARKYTLIEKNNYELARKIRWLHGDMIRLKDYEVKFWDAPKIRDNKKIIDDYVLMFKSIKERDGKGEFVDPVAIDENLKDYYQDEYKCMWLEIVEDFYYNNVHPFALKIDFDNDDLFIEKDWVLQINNILPDILWGWYTSIEHKDKDAATIKKINIMLANEDISDEVRYMVSLKESDRKEYIKYQKKLKDMHSFLEDDMYYFEQYS